MIEQLKVRRTVLDDLRPTCAQAFARHSPRIHCGSTSMRDCWSRSTPTIQPSSVQTALTKLQAFLAHTEQGFTREELRVLAANSIRASFLPDLEKARWVSQIDSFA